MPSDTFLFLGRPLEGGQQREVCPFGPTADGAFSTAVWVDVDPAAGPGGEACAVVSGQARLGADGSLILQPTADALAEVGAALDRDGALVLVWRNLDVATVRARLPATIASVEGGDSLGMAATGPLGRLRVGFEVVLIPCGLDVADELSFARILELVRPDALTRRLDPAVFYAALRDPAPLAEAHRGHPLLAALSHRTLVEIRDEWDEPSADSALVGVNGSSPFLVHPSPGARGILVLPKGAVLVQVTVPGSVLTVLPSDEVSHPTWTASVHPPSHVALQALYMPEAPTPADEARHWFAANTAPRHRFTAGNRVTPIRDGIDVFHAYAEAIRTAHAPGHSVCLAGWFLDDSFPLQHGDPASTFHALTTTAAEKGTEVRALLWDAVLFQNSEEVERINHLPGGLGQAVLDGDTLDVGSHHQKFLVVNGAEGHFAFAGGVDISSDRLDSPGHGAPGPFHDVQVKVEGPAVEDIRRTFADRWNHVHHPEQTPLPVEEVPPPPAGSAFVQIACTFPPRKRYPFAPAGALDPLAAFVRAVSKAKRYIYLEDQYLTPYPGMGMFEARHDLGLLGALREALKRIDYLVIVVPNHTDQPQGRLMRAQFLRSLYEVAREKVFVFYLKRAAPFTQALGEIAALRHGPRSGMSGNPDEIYCHSKTWIVDDIAARVGSANCCRRSYTHDSELDVVVVDGAVDNGARAFARRLRIELWQELFRLADPTLLEDYRRALPLFQNPPPTSLLRPYDPSHELQPTAADSIAVEIADIARHLRVPPERVAAMRRGLRAIPGEIAALGAEAVAAFTGSVDRALGETADELEHDPVLAWGLVDPDGR